MDSQNQNLSSQIHSQVSAIRDVIGGIAWQRCQVHFMRNVFDKLPRKNTVMIRDELKILFKTTNIDIARNIKNDIITHYCDKYQKMTDCLDESLKDAFQYCRRKSTKMLERLNS